jgi:hypothetical protein
VWRTTFSVPPRLIPGEPSWLMKWTGTAIFHAGLLAVDVEIENGGQEAAGINAAADIDGIDRDRSGRLVLAVNGSGDASSAALGAGGALASVSALESLHFLRGSHSSIPRQVFDRTAKNRLSGGAPASRDSASLLGSSGLIPAQIGRRNEAFRGFRICG